MNKETKVFAVKTVYNKNGEYLQHDKPIFGRYGQVEDQLLDVGYEQSLDTPTSLGVIAVFKLANEDGSYSLYTIHHDHNA